MAARWAEAIRAPGCQTADNIGWQGNFCHKLMASAGRVGGSSLPGSYSPKVTSPTMTRQARYPKRLVMVAGENTRAHLRNQAPAMLSQAARPSSSSLARTMAFAMAARVSTDHEPTLLEVRLTFFQIAGSRMLSRKS